MKRKVYRVGIYTAGLLVLALGITLNTKTGLGVSPIVSVPFVAAEISGWSIGDTTLVSYVVFLLLQILLKGKKFRAWDLLQFPLAIVFTRFMNLFSAWIPVQTVLVWQLAALTGAIVCTGVGAAMSLDMRLAPNPGDGAVQAIADRTGREMGLCKNFFDAANVVLAVVIALAVKHRILGIGFGTVAAIFGIGFVIRLFNKKCLDKLTALAGL